MATIPLGNFGNAVAAPGPLANVAQGNPLADAGMRTGQIAENVVNDMQQRQTDLQLRQRNAQAALSLAQTTNAMHDAHDAVARGVVDGSIPIEKAPGQLQQQISKIRDQALSGFADPSQRDVMDAHLTDAAGTLQRSLTGVIVKRQQSDAAASIDNFGEEMGRFALRNGPAQAVANYESYVKNTGPLAGLTPMAQQKLVQGFREKTHADFFLNAGTAALTNGDADALGKLVQQVQGPDGEPIDPRRRAIIEHTLFGWQQSLLAQRDRAANQAAEEARKQYNAAVDVFNQGTDIALAGGYFSPEFIQQLTTTAAGTDMAGPVANLIASQRTVAGFASRSADERAAIIERARAERANPQQGTDPLGEKLLGAMTEMDARLRRQAQDNPWAAAQQAGVIQDAPVLNLADPASAIQAIQARMQMLPTVENWTGQKASPLQPQEVEQLGKFVRQLPLDQASTMLGAIGNALGDQDRVAALAKQLHDKDGALGLAMLYANAQTTQGRKTAELVLRGEQALKDNTALIDKSKETGWQASIAKAIRGAYSNREVEDQAIEAAYKIGVANYADGKGFDADAAVKLATGGIAERNGQKFPLPYGMSESDFNKRLGAITADDLLPQVAVGADHAAPVVYAGRTAIPLAQFVQQLPNATLVHAGQGQYNVRAGNSLITNVRGQRITIRVNP